LIGGTAVLSKHKPLSIDMGLPGHPKASEVVKGRIITLEFDNYYVVGAYVPNAGQKLKSIDTRKEWNKHFAPFIRELDSKKPVIWTGDMNVAPTEKGQNLSLLTHNNLTSTCQISLTQNQIGIRLPVTQRSRQQLFAIYLTRLRVITSLLMSGGTDILKTSISHTLAIASIAELKVLAGG
jgi:exonuclease III